MILAFEDPDFHGENFAAIRCHFFLQNPVMTLRQVSANGWGNGGPRERIPAEGEYL